MFYLLVMVYELPLKRKVDVWDSDHFQQDEKEYKQTELSWVGSTRQISTLWYHYQAYMSYAVYIPVYHLSSNTIFSFPSVLQPISKYVTFSFGDIGLCF